MYVGFKGFGDGVLYIFQGWRILDRVLEVGHRVSSVWGLRVLDGVIGSGILYVENPQLSNPKPVPVP